VLELSGPVARERVPGLCAAVRDRLRRTGCGVVVCDVRRLDASGLAAVDMLARLQLAARREGGRIRLRGPGPGLRELLGLVGLPLDVEGEPEEGEPARSVQEAVEPGDPAV
jgi:ABC-type transporter Mla MlaB component